MACLLAKATDIGWLWGRSADTLYMRLRNDYVILLEPGIRNILTSSHASRHALFWFRVTVLC